MGELEVFCTRCNKKQSVVSIEHHVPMGRGRNNYDKNTWKVALERVGIWVECTVCHAKFIRTPEERNTNNEQPGRTGAGNLQQQ